MVEGCSHVRQHVTVADRFFRTWGRPFVDLFALGKNTKLAIYVSLIREETSWKVDNLVQNWNGLYAYAYPPTSLLRACLIKVKTENVEIVLIAPGWPNQEEFPDLLDLPLDFPKTLTSAETAQAELLMPTESRAMSSINPVKATVQQ